MEALLSTGWGLAVTIGAGLAIIVSLVKNIELIIAWFGKKAKDKVDHDDMEARIMQAVDNLDKNVRKRDEEQAKLIDKVFERIDELKATMADVQEQSSSLTYYQLMEAYTQHCVRKEPISVSKVASLERIYDAYIKGGRNHVPGDFKEKLKGCPIES